MSRQIRFYSLPEDEIDVLDLIVQFDVEMFPFRWSQPVPDPLSLPLVSPQLDGPGQVYIRPKLATWRKDEIIEYRIGVDSSSGLSTSASRVYYRFIPSTAPVIELTRSFVNALDKLTKGRFYVSCLDSERLATNAEESQAVLALTNAIWKWIKRRGHYHEPCSAYLLPHAYEQHASGELEIQF